MAPSGCIVCMISGRYSHLSSINQIFMLAGLTPSPPIIVAIMLYCAQRLLGELFIPSRRATLEGSLTKCFRQLTIFWYPPVCPKPCKVHATTPPSVDGDMLLIQQMFIAMCKMFPRSRLLLYLLTRCADQPLMPGDIGAIEI